LEFVDLSESRDNSLKVDGDICVVGAGAAGIYVSVQLAAKGMRVVLIEAGDRRCKDSAAVGFDTQFEAEFYPGATLGRYFGVGGSTSRWGGVLIPHTQHDLKDGDGWFVDSWSHIVKTVAAKADLVLAKLGWVGGSDFSSFAQERLGEVSNSLAAAGFDVSASLYLPFQRKNFVYLFKRNERQNSSIMVFYNAVAKSWEIEKGNVSEPRIKRLVAVSGNGKRVEITAPRFVIAAGAIESARILLELDDSAQTRIIRSRAAVGCFLADHLSISVAEVARPSLRRAIQLFAPRFARGWMRAFRFIERDVPSGDPRAFLHFIFHNENPGFACVKEVLSAMQARRWPSLSPSTVLSGTAFLLRLAYKRYVGSALYIPSSAPAYLQLDIEQVPVREHRVSLGEKLDRYGRRVAQISWGISERDVDNILRTAQRVIAKWPGAKVGLPEVLPRIDRPDSIKPYDAYHPVGTCRMGDDMEAVVDKNLKVWGLANVWVVSTGVLPSAGTANPTFTMLCLAEELVGRLTADRLGHHRA
jgi:choline dehydrogenase-like flavoprotein